MRQQLILAAAVSAVFAGSALAQTQFKLQRSTSISLTADFFGGATPSDLGVNPLALAFDGTNAYVSGFNNTGNFGNVGVLKIENILSDAPTKTPMLNTITLSNPSRGINGIAHDGTNLYTAYDSGINFDSYIRKYDADGNLVSERLDPQGVRPFALAIDPRGDNGNPAVAFLTQGSGRRRALSTSDLNTDLFNGTNGAIINSSPFLTTTWRDMAFDADGNIALGVDRAFFAGLRVADNQFSTLDSATVNATTLALTKDIGVNNVGNGVDILQGAATDKLLVTSPRVSGNGSGGTVQLTDSAGNIVAGLDSRHVQLRLLNGTTGYLTQTALTGAEDGFTGAYTGDIKDFATGVDSNGYAVLLVLSFLERRLDVYTVEPAWAAGTGGDWSQAANWTGPVPDSLLTNARFGDVLSGPATVNVDGDKTVKKVVFAGSNSYTLSGDTIGLDVQGNAELPVILETESGNHTIASRITLNDNLRIITAAGSSLTHSGELAATGRGITKLGAGEASVKNIRAGALVVAEGDLKIIAGNGNDGTSQVNALELTGGRLDLNDNGIAINYAAADPSPLLDYKLLVLTDVILSSAETANTTLGIAEAAAIGATEFGGLSIDDSTVLIRYTLLGDSNLDKTVDFSDLLAIARNFGVTGTAEWSDGDSNYDTNVDFTDLLALARNFGGSVLRDGSVTIDAQMNADFDAQWGLARSVVPEPATLGLLAGVALLGLRRR